MKREGKETRSHHSSLVRSLMYGTAAGALGVMTSAVSALAQQNPETVTITGTNIRGAQPTGQSLITVDREALENTGAVTVQQLIQAVVPQINGFGTAGQGAGAFEPRIHSVGGGSSNSTLSLVDGHVIPASGGQYRLADPSIIPPDAVERVDVLPDGASAIYGANAVAGVINIVTRKDFSGWSTTVQAGSAADYNTADASVIFGKAWDGGNMLATYSYSDRSNLMAVNRSFVGANKSNSGVGALNLGGTNNNNFNCYPATIVAVTGQTLAYPYTGTPINSASGTTNGICDTSTVGSLLPSEVGQRAFVSINEQITSRLKVSADLVYSQRLDTSRNSRGSEATVTVYGPGSSPPGGVGQINPFFVGPTGVTKETVSFNLDGLLGPGAFEKTGSQDVFATVTVDYDIGGDWAVDLTATSGQGTGIDRSIGTICIPCTNLALNGSINAAATTTTNASNDPAGTNTLISRPLTTLNALNIWGAAGSAKAGGANTASAILSSLVDNGNSVTSQRNLSDVRLKFDGPLFPLPGGDVKVAIGAEFAQTGSLATETSNNGTGATSTNSTVTITNLGRAVISGFAEIQLPIVGPEMGIPLVKRLDFNLSGRLDQYSDLASNGGVTTNPKIGMSWQVYDDLRIRASWGTSFSPPALGQSLATGGNVWDLRTGLTAPGGRGAGAFTIPSTYPGAAALCPTGCVFATGAVGPLNGIAIRGSNTSLVPQTGTDYSGGFTFNPSFVPGFYADVTFWGANYMHVITNSQSGPATNIASPGLFPLFIVGPTQAQIASALQGRVVGSPLPANIQYIYDERLTNLLNYQAQGIDYSFNYQFDAQNYGNFTLGVNLSEKTKFKQQQFAGAPWVQALNIGNASGTASPVALAGRFNLGWKLDAITMQASMNYTAPYYNTTSSAVYAAQYCPPGVNATGFGCEKIGANVTFDLHGAYNLVTDFIPGGTQVFVDIQNLFDAKPPFIDSANGYDGGWSNPIGRLLSIGFRQKF